MNTSLTISDYGSTYIHHIRSNRDFRKVNLDSDNSMQILVEMIRMMLPYAYSTSTQPLIIVCIGTPESTGDAVGPHVGSILKELNRCASVEVYGTIESPLDQETCFREIPRIKKHAKKIDAKIIAVDAGIVEDPNDLSVIYATSGAISPGEGVDAEVPTIGDLHIIAGVAKNGENLDNVDRWLIARMIDLISNSLYSIISR